MNCDKYVSQINDYLNNELNKVDRKDFENCLNTNTEFKDLVEDIRRNDSYLERLPDIETKSDFILNLNKRIDEYDSNHFSILDILKGLFVRENAPQFIGVLSVFLIISFSFFKISDLNILSNFYNITDNNIIDTPPMALNDADSLNNINNDVPILLIGNEK